MSTSPSFQIRDAQPDEQDAIRDLTLAAYEQYATIMAPPAWAGLHRAIQSALARNGGAERIVAVQADGGLLGSVFLYPADTNAYGRSVEALVRPELRLLAVSAAARRQGVGKALVQECLRRAARAGADALGLHTSASMQAAIHLYEQLGFIRSPADDFQPPGTELIMAYRRSVTDTDPIPAE